MATLLLERLQELREKGEYDPSVVSNALKMVQNEDIKAYIERHPLESMASGSLLRELEGLDMTFASTRNNNSV